MEEAKRGGSVLEVFHVLERQQRYAGRAERHVERGDGYEGDSVESTTAQDKREAGKEEDGKA